MTPTTDLSSGRAEGPAACPRTIAGGSRALARKLPRGVSAVVVAVAVQSVGNLVFHSVAGRSLGPADYGALGSVLAVMVLLAVPLTGLQTAASAAVATNGGVLTRGSMPRLVGLPTLVALAPAALLVALAGPVAEWLRLSGTTGAILLAPSLVVAVALACLRGMLLGAGAPGPVALGYVVSVAARLLSVVLLTPTVESALVGSLLGEVLATALAVHAVRRRSTAGTPSRLGRVRLARSVTALLVLFVFTSSDLFLARHHLTAEASGSYVAAATLAKTVLALPAAAMAVLFPSLVRSWAGDGPARGVSRVAVVVVGLAALGAAVVLAAPGLLLEVLFHDAYAGSAPVLRVLTLTALLSSVVTVAVNSALARGSITAVTLPLAGTVVELALISLRHASTMDIAWGSAVSALVTALLALALELRAVMSGRVVHEEVKPASTLRQA